MLRRQATYHIASEVSCACHASQGTQHAPEVSGGANIKKAGGGSGAEGGFPSIVLRPLPQMVWRESDHKDRRKKGQKIDTLLDL